MLASFPPQGPWNLPDPALVPVINGERFLALMGRLDRFSGQWQRLKSTSPEEIEQLRIVATIESVASSTRIEGAQLSDDQVRQLLEGGGTTPSRVRDQQEVRGYRDLVELFRQQHATLSISENSLKAFHRVLLAHSDKDAYHRGDYKRTPNHVERQGDGPPAIVFMTAPPAETRWWMERLVAELNARWDDSSWHKLLLIADFIMWFLAIHPFQDGNGRLARALTTLLAMKAGYDYVSYASLERVIEDRKAAYYVALQRSQVAARSDARDYGVWVDFFLSAMEAQQQVLEERVAKAAQRSGLRGLPAAIVQLLTERGAMTTPEIATALAASTRTVRYHLATLVRNGVVEAPARTAGRRYALPLAAVATPIGEVSAADHAHLADQATVTESGEAMLSTLDFAPVYQQQLMSSPNGRAFATVIVVGSSRPVRTPLGDAELDAFEAFVARVAPQAEPMRATPEVGWWRLSDSPLMDRLQLWLLPGPVVQVHWALDSADMPDDGLIALDPRGLVTYWRWILAGARDAMTALNVPSAVLGLNVQTIPSSRPSIVDIDFQNVPLPTRSGTPQQAPPPWSAQRLRAEIPDLVTDGVLRPGLDQLLRHFSYRHTDATISAVFGGGGGDWQPTASSARLLGRMGTRQEPSTLG